MSATYNLSQLMVTAAAREISDNEIIFVGMRLPLLGYLLAKSTHAPGAVGVYELGVVRDSMAPAPILTMGDLPNLYRAQWLADTGDMMGLLQSGWVDASFIGGAQVDRYGNLNTSYIGGVSRVATRLPGSGGACDVASFVGRTIIFMQHEKRKFVNRLDYVTSPGWLQGAGMREQSGLAAGGPAVVITNMAVMAFDDTTREMYLMAVFPGISPAQVLDHMEFKVDITRAEAFPPPSAAELAILRERCDPQRLILE